MSPMRLMLAGLLITLLDLNVARFDVIADPVGWALVAWGAHQLVTRQRDFVYARGLAAAMAVLSVFPYFMDTMRSNWFPLVAVFVATAFQFTLCTGLSGVIGGSRSPLTGQFNALRWGFLVIGLAQAATIVLTGDPRGGPRSDPGSALLYGSAGVLGLVLMIWLCVALYRADRVLSTGSGASQP